MKTYRETMDELRFTEQEKEAMVDRLLEGGGSRRRGLNLRGRPWLWLLPLS